MVAFQRKEKYFEKQLCQIRFTWLLCMWAKSAIIIHITYRIRGFVCCNSGLFRNLNVTYASVRPTKQAGWARWACALDVLQTMVYRHQYVKDFGYRTPPLLDNVNWQAHMKFNEWRLFGNQPLPTASAFIGRYCVLGSSNMMKQLH